MKMRASVLIPVKNGGALLGQVLDKVLAQKTEWPFEVIVIDSGSSDESVSLVRSKKIRCETIAPENFGHGRTRNLLASMSSGEFLIYLTQDAIPVDEYWLQRLVDACDMAPDVAGAFGPHRAHINARKTTARELDQHFAGFGQDSVVIRLEDSERFERDVGYRQWLHFFSSNNACLRRSVWEQIPLPDVAFAEDQTWALEIIRAGYAKAYSPKACVYHSHDFGLWETMQRNFDESRSFNLHFGYVIQPGLYSAFRSGSALVMRDFGWLRDGKNGLISWVVESLYMAGIEMARVLGQYLGSRHKKLPRLLLRFISRDERLQRLGA